METEFQHQKKQKKVIGLMKDEPDGKIITKFGELKARGVNDK